MVMLRQDIARRLDLLRLLFLPVNIVMKTLIMLPCYLTPQEEKCSMRPNYKCPKRRLSTPKTQRSEKQCLLTLKFQKKKPQVEFGP